ncbi:hypothetical protein KAH81_06175 [bacterium]|nr:hypothetical protein [bacterium]
MKALIKFFLFILILSSSILSASSRSEISELLTPEISGDRTLYEEWKANLFIEPEDMSPRARPSEAMDWLSGNNWVRADVDETSGEFDEGADPGGGGSYVRLTYSFPGSPGTEWVMYYVDGYSAKTDESLPNTSSNYMTGSTVYSIWNNWHGVYIRQEITPVSLGGTPGENEQVKFKTVMKPADGSCHDVGCIVYYDTMLDDDDYAEISTAYGYTGIAEIFFAPDIPPTWRAYQGGYPPGPGVLTALGVLIGFEAVMPDVFWYGNWPSSVGNGWADSDWVTDTGSSYGDSATMVKWYPRNVCPGDSAIFVTYYGIGDITSGTGLRIYHTPPMFETSCTDITPNPFTVEAFVTNIGTSTALNVQATLDLSGTPFTLASGANPQNLGSIAGYGGSALATWTVSIPPSAYGTTQCYNISATWSGGGPEIENYCINIPETIDFGANATVEYADICAGGCTELSAWPDSIGSGYDCGSWSSDFESSVSMTHSGSSDDWAWGTPSSGPGSAHSGSRCWGTDLGGAYNNSESASLVTPGVDITGCSNATLSFWHSYYTASFDGCQVYIGTSPTGPWFMLDMPGYDGMHLFGPMSLEDSYHGSQGWTNETIDISSWCGDVVYIRFLFESDFLFSDDGWYIDDVSVTGSGSSAGPVVYDYSWSPTTGLSDPTSPNPTACPTTTTTYSCQITALEDCIAIAPVTVNVHPDPEVDITPVDICEGETATLTANVTPPGTYTYSWTPGGFTTQDITITPGTTTTYTCFVSSSFGCDGSDTGSVIVHPNPILTVEDQFICFGDSATLTAILSPDLPGATFSWEPGGLVGNPILVSPRDTTEYVCTVTSPFGCQGYDSATVFVDYPPIAPTLIAPADGSTDHTPDALIAFNWSASAGTPPITYDVILDGFVVAAGLSGTRWSESFLCGERHTWAIIVHGLCGSDTSEVWSFSTAPCIPPHIEIIEPLDGLWSACDDQGIFVMITDDDSVDASSIRFSVNGITYLVDRINLDFYYDTLRFTPPSLWSDGETLHCCVDSVCDIYGVVNDTLPVCWDWYVDISAPVVWGEIPTAGSTIPEASPTVSFNIYDSLSGLDEISVIISINDSILLDLYSAGVSYVAPNVSVSFLDLGLAFDIGDTVEICITANDLPDYCAANVLDTCWFFIVNPLGPIGMIIEPLPWTYSACDDQGIIVYIFDADGIDHSSVLLNVDGIDVHGDDSTVIWSGDTLAYSSPTLWDNGDTILVRLLECVDLVGNPLGDTLHWNFIVDLTPPVIWGIDPIDSTVLALDSPSFTFVLADWLSGLDISLITISINGTTHYFGDPGFEGAFTGDSLFCSVDCADLGYVFSHNDTVRICIGAADSPDYCPPNVLTHCWVYYIDILGPIYSMIFDPSSGDALANTVSACDDQGFCLELLDSDIPHGLDESSIILRVNGTDYTTADPELNYISDTLCFAPSVLWTHAAHVRVELISADDIFGNPLAYGTDTWEYEIDLESPLAFSLAPAPGSGIGTLTPVVGFNLTDEPAGTNLDGVLIGVDILPSSDTSWFDLSESWFSRTDSIYSANIIDIPLFITGGDTVRICIRSSDIPDFCLPNTGDTCWTFFLPTGGPVATVIEPVDGSWSACHLGEIILTVSDPDTVIGGTIIFSVDGVHYMTTASELEYRPDTLIYSPSSDWSDGAAVICSLLYAEDRFGNPNEDTLIWTFNIDFEAPIISSISPIPGSVVASLCPNISFDLADFGSGLYEASIEVTVDGSEYLDISDGRVVWAGGNFSFDLCDVITVVGGSVIDICVYAEDLPDYCGPNVLDTCWSFDIEPGGPAGTIVHPTDGIITSCDPQDIVISIFDSNGVDGYSIVFEVNGLSYTADDPELDWSEPSLTFDGGSGFFTHGSTVVCSLLAASDVLSNPLETLLGWSFIVDYQPPVLISVSPTPGVPVDDRSPLITLILEDTPAGIDYNSASLDVEGYGVIDLLIPALYWHGDTLLFDPDSLGILWTGGDSIELCLGIADLPDTVAPYCDANDTTYCRTIVISRGGPIAEIIEPLDSTVSACSLQQIIVTIEDSNSISDSTILLRVNGIDYRVGSLRIEWDEPTLIWTPPSIWADGPVHVELVSADDLLGNELVTPLDWWFWMDLTPPAFWSRTPAPFAIIDNPSPDISVHIADSIAGLADSCLWMTLNDSIIFNLTSPDISWDGEIMALSCSDAGLFFSGGDNIDICVHACDDPDYCPPNDSLHCWRFSIATGGPIATIIEPLDGTVSACSLQQIIVTLVDSNGVDETTIQLEVGGVVYTTSDDELDLDDPTLTWTPPSVWSDGLVNVSLISADDMLGNPLAGAPVSWSFTMDLTPPQFASLYPVDGFITLDWQQTISIDVTDSILGVDADSLDIRLDGVYRSAIPISLRVAADGVDWVAPLLTLDPASVMASAFGITYSAPEDTLGTGIYFPEFGIVSVIITAFDNMPDYCEPNSSSVSWNFSVGDDDTLGPNIYDFRPEYESTQIPVFIEARITDPSGVFGAELIWDTDGEVDIDANGPVPMDSLAGSWDAIEGGWLWRTTSAIGTFISTTNISYRITSTDNDFDFLNPLDRTTIFADSICQILGGPTAAPITPLPGQISSCADQPIVIELVDPDGVDPSPMVLVIAGQQIIWPDSRLSYDGAAGEITFAPGVDFWANEQIVTVMLTLAEDSLGNPMWDTLSYNWLVDLEPPTFSNNFPASANLIRDGRSPIWVDIEDNLAGIRESELAMDVYGNHYELSLSELNYEEGRLSFDAAASDVEFVAGDTVRITAYAGDNPDLCESNLSAFSWWFVMEPKITCNIYPNPITTNGDGINDAAVFDYPLMFSGSAELFIFDIRNTLVYSSTIGPIEELTDVTNRFWDGKDRNGISVRPGLYLYVIQQDGEAICNGTISVNK